MTGWIKRFNLVVKLNKIKLLNLRLSGKPKINLYRKFSLSKIFHMIFFKKISKSESYLRNVGRKMIRKSGCGAKLQFPVHPHMLRHGCGYYLATKGIDTRAIQEYLGHANISHTVRYTQLAPHRFDGFWDDWQLHNLLCNRWQLHSSYIWIYCRQRNEAVAVSNVGSK
jgi:integrase